MKYSKSNLLKMSDFEINKNVASVLKLNVISYDITGIVLYDDMDATPFDPCNNPQDAMPIVVDNLISLIADSTQSGSSNWWDIESVCGEYCVNFRVNPYRGAMEVFLMINDEV